MEARMREAGPDTVTISRSLRDPWVSSEWLVGENRWKWMRWHVALIFVNKGTCVSLALGPSYFLSKPLMCICLSTFGEWTPSIISIVGVIIGRLDWMPCPGHTLPELRSQAPFPSILRFRLFSFVYRRAWAERKDLWIQWVCTHGMY